MASKNTLNIKNNSTEQATIPITDLDNNSTNNELVYFKDSRIWYKFLQNLYLVLSEYRIQKNISKYNVLNIDDWGEKGRPQGLKVNKDNFQLFLDKIAQYGIPEHKLIDNFMITELQFKELNYVLNLTLKFKVDVRCTESYKLIKGNNIVIKNIINHISVDNSCKKPELNKTKSLVIFALDTVFIDKDIVQPELQITIIAPKWEIIGKRTINLTGFTGDHYKTYTNIDKIDDGKPGENGRSGNPGLPGGPGGVFFGVGQNFIKGQHLTIMASGGKGGKGEAGTSGNDGEKGTSVDPPTDIKCGEDLCESGRLGGFRCVKLSCKKDYYLFNELLPRQNCVFNLYGDPGMKGGNGGYGGRGGKGGKAGNIMLLEMDEYSGVSKYAYDGPAGVNGTGGAGGISGKHGDNLLLSCFSDVFRTNWKTKVQHSNVRLPPGRKGTDGGNFKNIENPKKVKSIFKTLKIIDEYKSYLRENLKNYYGTPTLIKFLNHLENDYGIKKMYDTLGLFNELDSLEKQFYKLNSGVSFLPFYESLLDRIQEYARNPKMSEITDQFKKALSYLYTATLSRINDMEKNLESRLIVNIEDHLMSVKNDVDKLKNFQTAKNKADIISKYRKKYKTNIDKKIDEAKDLIQKYITPQINDINSQIDKDIDQLVRSVVNKEDKLRTEGHTLNDDKLKLEKALRIKALFSVVEFASQAVGYLGPVGAFAGGVIGEVSSVSKTFILDKENLDTKLLQLPESVMAHVHEGKGLLTSMMSEKVDRFDQLLRDTSEEISKNPENFGELSNKIHSIQQKLQDVNPENFNFKKVTALENEFQQELSMTKEKINVNKNSSKKLATISEKIDRFTNRFEKVYRFGLGIFELTNNFKDDQPEVDAITDAIENNQDDFRVLKDFEESIYNTLSPTLNAMKSDLDETTKNLGTKSKVALDVTKWQVQNALRDVKQKIQKMVATFREVNDDLTDCIQKLNESMDILIDVYNHIEDYHKQQNLADYIAEVSSDTANSLSITDPNLDKAVNKLEILIISNLILERYEVSMSAFKQFVFPFAHRYLNDGLLPSFLVLNNNLDNLATEVVEKIDLMIANLKKYKNSISDYKNNVGSGKFSGGYLSIKPFFVWKNEKYKNVISKFLAGEEVLVKADIKKSEVTENAIKFNVLSFDLQARNLTRKAEIYNILKAFKINLTHLGNSFYRYDNKTYSIPTSIYNIWYHYEQDGGVPVKKSSEYDDIKKGNYMLSPFATWKLKLTNIPNDKNVSYSDLEVYKNEIDLELGGYASYVEDDGKDHTDLMLHNYYKTVEEDHLIVNRTYSAISEQESLLEKINTIYQKPKGESNLPNLKIDNSGLVSNKWSRWKLPEFPNLNLLPVARAHSIEEMNRYTFKWDNFGSYVKKRMDSSIMTENLKGSLKTNDKVIEGQDSNSFLNNMSSYFINIVEKVKNTVFTEKEKLNVCSFDCGLVSNCHTNQIPKNSELSNIEFSNSKNPTKKTMMNIDLVGGNLVLAQLVSGKLFGTNETLQNHSYLSPDQERVARISNLSQEISSTMKEISTLDKLNKILMDYNTAPEWYQDLYKPQIEEMVAKRIFRDNQKHQYLADEFLSEKIFAEGARLLLF